MSSSKAAITVAAMTTFDTAFLQPAVKFTAVREKDPADSGTSDIVVEQVNSCT